MTCYLSTSCYGRTKTETAISHCRKISPKHVEISAPHHFQPVEELEKLLNKLKTEGVNLTLHNYFPAPIKSFVLDIASADKDCRDASYKLVINALKLCKAAGSPVYGIHAGYLRTSRARKDGMFVFSDNDSGGGYEAALIRATSFVSEIAEDFEAANVNLLIENLFPSPVKQFSLFCTLDEITEYLALVPESIGLLLDLGHLNVSSTILGFDKGAFLESYLDQFGSRVMEVHISENRGKKDEHLPIKRGSWQLDVLNELKSVPVRDNKLRVYCVEARNADRDELTESIDLVNNILN